MVSRIIVDGNVEYDEEMWAAARRPLPQARVITCACGARLELWLAWANECEQCGQEYNGFGQRLAPRSAWGEETGERFAGGSSARDEAHAGDRRTQPAADAEEEAF